MLFVTDIHYYSVILFGTYRQTGVQSCLEIQLRYLTIKLSYTLCHETGKSMCDIPRGVPGLSTKLRQSLSRKKENEIIRIHNVFSIAEYGYATVKSLESI